MSYVIRIVGPAGAVRFLTADQREVEHSKDAEKFESYDKADAAAYLYEQVAKKCWSYPPIVLVSDLDQEGP